MVKNSTEYGRRLNYILSKLPQRNFYTMHEFFLVCPYSHEELKIADRSRDKMQWRQLGMAWATLTGLSLTESGNMFNKDHATVIYSQQMLIDALDGFHPLLMQKFSDVLDCIEINNTNASDFNTAFIISARNIERMLRTKLKKLNQI
jgi:hypothetical protein